MAAETERSTATRRLTLSYRKIPIAQDRDEVSTPAVAGFSAADVLLAGGAFEPSRAMLGSLTLPPVTAATAGFVAVVTTSHAIDAALEGRPGDAAAPMDAAVRAPRYM